MTMLASQNTSLPVVCSIVYSDVNQRKHQSSASLAFVRELHAGTGEFSAQMASYAENVSIWWRHHENQTSHAIEMLNDFISHSLLNNRDMVQKWQWNTHKIVAIYHGIFSSRSQWKWPKKFCQGKSHIFSFQFDYEYHDDISCKILKISGSAALFANDATWYDLV